MKVECKGYTGILKSAFLNVSAIGIEFYLYDIEILVNSEITVSLENVSAKEIHIIWK